ncbi:cytochrome c biogenesis CcdA family protein [Catellatospora coxensis]|uniref:Cytochrome C biogenesis protein transmembrane domain-containing protein n=1 Tax=Catellatospora coxensis TaxID=310354 RepID=A0A8J3KMD1_9ACTN|nr:cytochrome c biogenesis protein CcdA [Catellatospora coxensis]GIG05652.1 hypothetical protein Cco03nite_23520 [Catellatospora coxensis]
MDTASYSLALSAGLLAAVNPCGFAMLPAYVSLLVTADHGGQPPRWPTRLARALAMTAAMTAGFVTVFGGFGLLAAPAADWIAARLPWVTVCIGLVLLALGGWLTAGRQLPSPVPKTGAAPHLRQRFWPMYLFGMSFAVALLGCTIGPFLAVVVTAFTTGSAASGAGLFVAYATGMAVIVGAIAVAVAAAQQTAIRWLRRAGAVVSRLGGVLMVAAGAYVAWYGWYEIRLYRGQTTADPVIDAAAAVQQWLSQTLDSAGPAAIAVTLALAVFTTVWWHRSRSDT